MFSIANNAFWGVLIICSQLPIPLQCYENIFKSQTNHNNYVDQESKEKGVTTEILLYSNCYIFKARTVFAEKGYRPAFCCCAWPFVIAIWI